MARRKAVKELGDTLKNIISWEDASERLKSRGKRKRKQSGGRGGNVKPTSSKKPTSKPISDEKGHGRGRFQKGSAPAPKNQNVSTRIEDDAADFVNKGGAGKVESRGDRMVRGTVAGGSKSSTKAAKEKVRLQAIIRDESKTKKQRDAAQAKLDKMRAGDEAATKTARRKGTQTKRKKAQAERERNPEGVKDAVAYYMRTGKKALGFEPTPRQIEQYKQNKARRTEMSKSRKNRRKFEGVPNPATVNKKGGGQVYKRKKGGSTKKKVSGNDGNAIVAACYD